MVKFEKIIYQVTYKTPNCLLTINTFDNIVKNKKNVYHTNTKMSIR